MSVLSGISNLIASIPAPKTLQKTMLAISKEGPAAIVLPEASVISGRTIAAGKRDGFLGAQERGPEEITVAIFWLYGVKLLAGMFDKYIRPRLFPGFNHLPSKIAWKNPWGHPSHVDLTPQERFVRSAAELGKLVRIKTLRLLTSTGLVLGLVAWVIPKLNVWKTNWVIRHFYGNNIQPNSAARQPEPEKVRPLPDDTVLAPTRGSGLLPKTPATTFSTPTFNATTPQTFTPSLVSPSLTPPSLISSPSASPFPDPFSTPSAFPLAQPFSFPQPTQAGQISSPPPVFQNSAWPPVQQPTTTLPTYPMGFASHKGASKLRFGFQVPGSALFQGLGHLIEQTAYGNVLVVDTGITTGRTTVAYQREPMEAPEKVFQEIASLYFYMLAQPHVMKFMSKFVIDPIFGTSMLMEPVIARRMTELIQRQLEEMAKHRPDLRNTLQHGNVPLRAIEEIILGSAQKDTLMQPAAWLGKAMRTASVEGGNGFMPLLKLELQAILRNTAATETTHQQIQEYLAPLVSDGTLSTKSLYRLLTAIQNRHGLFANLEGPEQANLTLAIKNAFRHTAGLPYDLTGNSLEGPIANTLKQLSEPDRQALLARMQRMARIDAWDQANTMLRRSLNVAREHLTATPETLPISEEIRTNWQVEAAKRGISQETLATEKLLAHTEAMADWLDRVVSGKLTPEELIRSELADIRELTHSLELQGEMKALLEKPEAFTANHLKQLAEALEKLQGQGTLDPFRKHRISQALNRAQTLNGIVNPAIRLPAESAGKALFQLASENLADTVSTLSGSLKSETPAEIRELLTHYRQAAEPLLRGTQGRLLSLSITDAESELNQKLKEILLGGLQNDSAFVRKAQEIIGQFTPDSREYASPEKRRALQESINLYTDRFLDRAREAAGDVGEKLIRWRPMMEKYGALNRNLNYFSRFLALGVAMYGLGILVPKLQFALTQKLTGRNENPGIAQAKQAAGLTSGKSRALRPNSSSSSALYTGGGLNRNNFRMFQQQSNPAGQG
jgi:hypothetical protein